MSKVCLDRIELCDFKSFRGEHMIGPFHPFTGIVGPNGAGKSNVLDSLAFCLFLDETPRSTNYIYRNPTDVDATSCFVRVILKEGDEEISLERKLVETQAAGGSEAQLEQHCSVNGEEVEEKAYVEAVRGYGITPLCFVKQAEVDIIARMTPQELTSLLEKYSGSMDYYVQYEDLRVELESAQQEVSMIEKRRRTTQAEKHNISGRKEEVTKYEKLNEELNSKELQFALFQLYSLYERYKAATDGSQDLENEIEKGNRKIEQLQDNRREIQKESNESIEQLTSVDAKKQASEQALRDLRASLAIEQERREFFERAIEDKKREIASKESATQDWQKLVEQHKQEVEEIKSRLNDLPDPGLLREDIAKYNSIRAQSSRLYSDLARNLREAKAKRDSAKSELNQLKKDAEVQQESLQRTIATLAKISEDKKKHEHAQAIVEQKLTEAKSSKALSEASDRSDKSELNSKAGKLKDVEKKYDELRRTAGTSKRRERFNKAVANLKRLVPGVYGLLGEFYKPSKESYKLAILAGIGDQLDHLVVKDRQVGMRCLEYFKEQGIGSITTIPIKGYPVRQQKSCGLPPLSKFVIPKSDEYKAVFEFVCSGIVFASTQAEGTKVSFKHGINVAVEDGTFIDHHGIIKTGIPRESQAYNNEELVRLRQEKIDIERSINEINERIEHRRPEITNYESQIETLRFQVDGYIRKIRELVDQRKQFESNERTIRAGAVKIANEITQKEQELKSKEVEYSKFAAEQSNIDKDLFADIKLETGDNIQDIEARFNERMTLESRLEYLESIIPDEENADPQKTIATIRERLEQFQNDYDEARKNIASYEQEISKEKGNVDHFKNEYIENHQKHEEISAELGKLNREIRDLTSEVENNNNELLLNRHELDVSRQQISSILQHCKISNIKLPHSEKYTEKEITSTLSNESQIQEDMETIQQINFSSLSAALKSMKSENIAARSKTFETDISTLKQQLSQIKPDLTSSTKYEQIEKEIAEMKAKSEKTAADVKKKKAEFTEARENRRSLFMKLYDSLDVSINPIYQMFTRRGARNDHSGVAYLAMEDTDEPYLGGIKFTAMPPHKRFRDLEQLSGGEKAVASLALIVALQKYLKAPFIIFDEPDASLDKVNLKTASIALREISEEENGPQIVCVSLRQRFFEYADVLAGVYKEIESQSSGVLTMNLTEFREQSLKMDEI